MCTIVRTNLDEPAWEEARGPPLDMTRRSVELPKSKALTLRNF